MEVTAYLMNHNPEGKTPAELRETAYVLAYRRDAHEAGHHIAKSLPGCPSCYPPGPNGDHMPYSWVPPDFFVKVPPE